jgi:ComF family protein
VDALLAVLVAPSCAACGSVLESPLEGPVCADCWRTIPPLAERERLAADGAVMAADYQGPLRDILHAFKYERRRSLARPLARVLAQAGRDVLDGASCVVPVPLHPFKRLARGFNQAADLASYLGPPVIHALWRSRPTRAQVGLAAARRRQNVRGAFRASPLLTRQRRAAFITGRVVVLVDDVRTTGSTLRECERVLQTMGAREVRKLTLAQAPVQDRQRSRSDTAS